MAAAVVRRQCIGLPSVASVRRGEPSGVSLGSSNEESLFVVGRQRNAAPVVASKTRSRPSRFSFGLGSWNELLFPVVARAKSISVRSVGGVGEANRKTTARRAAVAVTTTAAAAAAAATAAPVAVVASSQQSSAKIQRSNRRSRFGEPLSTMDCDVDDEVCEALLAEFHALEVESFEEEIDGRMSHRKGKRINRAAAKRVDNVPRSHVITHAPKGGKIPAMKRMVRSDGVNGTPIKSGPVGTKLKSERARSNVDENYAMGGSHKVLTDAAWEEQAYQIIRRQKLRDAAQVATTDRTIVQTPKLPAKTRTIETVSKVPTIASLKHGTSSALDGGSKEDGEVTTMSKKLGLEDKCEALLAYMHSLGVREREFIRIVDKHKTCLQANVNLVKERVEFLLSVGVQFQHLPKLIVRHPQILDYRVEQAMRPRVQYLKSLGLDESKIGKIITVSPSLLECSLERSIKPRISYLEKTVGIKSEDIGKIVTRSPQILTQSIKDSLEPRLDFYLNELKLSRTALAKMVTRHPQLLHYSVEDGVRPRVQYLRSLGMSDDDVIKVLSRLTQILSLSVENCLQPKYNYLVKELGGGVHTVTSFPAYFSLSLEQRIIPRRRYSQFLERTPEGPFPMRLLTISDVAFCHWAKSSVEAYDKFRHGLLLNMFAQKFERKNKLQV